MQNPAYQFANTNVSKVLYNKTITPNMHKNIKYNKNALKPTTKFTPFKRVNHHGQQN